MKSLIQKLKLSEYGKHAITNKGTTVSKPLTRKDHAGGGK
jgi:hypothetical protein